LKSSFYFFIGLLSLPEEEIRGGELQLFIRLFLFLVPLLFILSFREVDGWQAGVMEPTGAVQG
jgi:hypothetical protein